MTTMTLRLSFEPKRYALPSATAQGSGVELNTWFTGPRGRRPVILPRCLGSVPAPGWSLVGPGTTARVGRTSEQVDQGRLQHRARSGHGGALSPDGVGRRARPPPGAAFLRPGDRPAGAHPAEPARACRTLDAAAPRPDQGQLPGGALGQREHSAPELRGAGSSGRGAPALVAQPAAPGAC